MDKKRLVHKKLASAHLILWIFRHFSTDGPARSDGFLFFCLQNRQCGGAGSNLRQPLRGPADELAEDLATCGKNVLGNSKPMVLPGTMMSPGVFISNGAAVSILSGFDVYLKSMYTSIVVVVNAATVLWIMAKSRVGSSVYDPYKPVT